MDRYTFSIDGWREKNIEEAVRWYRKSAERGYAETIDALQELGY